jgi:hypothetical protein
MKAILTCSFLFIALSANTALHAQEVREAKVRYAKSERPGLLADFPYSRAIVESALRARLEKAGFAKPKSDRGFASYQAATWPEVAPGQVDVYTRVDGKGAQSTVVLLVSKGYDNYVSAASDAVMAAKLKAFLNSLLPDIRAEQLRADMLVQEEMIRRAEKAFKDIDDDANKLAREKERIEKQMAENASEKARRAESLNAERGKLEAMRALVK